MKKVLVDEKKSLLLILALYLITFILTYGRMGSLTVDCGREAYIPYAIMQNKVLYKDIFCIYGPFPYLFNAFFYKIIGANLNVLYFIGGIFGLIYTIGVYLCSREFLSKSISLCISALIIYSVIFDSSIFNFIFPYSYAIVFASTCAIWILYFLLKYVQTKNIKFIHYCMFLWGVICVSKIEFIPVILIILAVFYLYEKENKKEFLKSILYALIIPAITYFVLFTQGLSISDLMKNSFYVKEMVKTQSFDYFYSRYSVLSFSLKNFLINTKGLISTFFVSALYFYLTLFAIRKRKKLLKYSLITVMVIFCYVVFFMQETIPQMIFATLPYICAVALIIYLIKFLQIKDYKNNKYTRKLVLLSFALICSIKNFHALLLGFYGSYSFAPLLICLTLFIKEYLSNNALYNTKKQYEGVLCAYLIILALVFANQLTISLLIKNVNLKSSFGLIKAPVTLVQPFKEALEYLNLHAENQKSLLVMPEGIMLNFLSGKEHEFYQTSFIPLDFDTFKEDNIINEIKLKKPQFIAFTNRETDEYGQNYICKDYGVKTCKYVVKNYSLEAVFGEKFRIYLFKNKELEDEKE